MASRPKPSAKARPNPAAKAKAAASSRKAKAPPPAVTPPPAAAPARSSSTPKKSEAFVVGVGASAGGLQALQAFFGALREPLNAAFVVVQHLSPDFKSFMVELLAKHTQMPVQRAEQNALVRPGNIYLIPPKVTLTISRGRLQLAKNDPRRGLHLPIDEFFISLAQDLQRRAIAVVLSGTGSDGTAGIRAIKDAGGMVMVQSEDSAQFDGMPRSAIATGLADFVLAPPKMPEQLAAYLSHPLLSKTHDVNRRRGAEVDSVLSEIFILLRSQCGVDFSHYKPATIDRRIERRMSVCQIDNLPDYVRHLAQSSREVTLLFNELLIGVTSFFRDRPAWQTVEKDVLPGLLKSLPANEPIRAWSSGCCTGEEAYTLAILVAEAMDKLKLHNPVKIFATDISKEALGVAARGHYSPTEVAGVTPARLEQFFIKESGGFRVKSRLREMVVFANHNLLSDPPFTKLSLISCRNLLIYLSAPMQQRLLTLFSFALRDEGVLFLGSSESIGDATDRFQPIATRANLYRNRRVGQPPPMLLNSSRVVRRAPALESSGALQRATARAITGDVPSIETVHRQIVAEFAPACLVLDGRDEVVHILGSAGDYLKLSEGGITRNIFKLTQHNLANALRSALIRAQQKGDTFTYDNVRFKEGRKLRVVRIHIRPMLDKQGKLTGTRLVYFEKIPTAQPAGRGSSRAARYDSTNARRIADLERDLSLTRESLQATVQDLETSNEEIQAANEELLAANEELQSTNEELQSVNEELHTVNVENQTRIEEFTRLSNDLNNLLATAAIGVLLVDAELRVRRASNSALLLLDLTDAYLGVPIETVARILHAPELPGKAQHVMAHGNTEELEVRRADAGRWMLLRCVPFRSETGRTQGVVVTIIDITERHRDQERSLAQAALTQTMLDAIDSSITVLSRHGDILLVNNSWRNFVQSNEAAELETLSQGNNFFDICSQAAVPSGLSAPECLEGLRQVLRGERTAFSYDYAHGPATIPTERRWYRIHAVPLHSPEEGLVLTHFDITPLKKAEHLLDTAGSAGKQS
ncbi:MAG: chemotaxis protein CheB [Verrucomicrobiota bacterium]